MSIPGNTKKYTDVKTDGLSCETWKNMLLVKYYDDPLVVQSPWINLNAFGIPRIDKYHPKEEDRRYLRVPLSKDPEDSFVGFVKMLDDYFDSEGFRKTYLPDKQQKFQYYPLLKESASDKYPPSLKLKIETRTGDDGESITTTFIKLNDDNKTERLKVYNMDDAIKAIPFKSDIRMLFRVMKVWVQPSMKSYGCILRLKKVQVKKSPKANINEGEDDFVESEQENNNNDDFVEDDTATAPPQNGLDA